MCSEGPSPGPDAQGKPITAMFSCGLLALVWFRPFSLHLSPPVVLRFAVACEPTVSLFLLISPCTPGGPLQKPSVCSHPCLATTAGAGRCLFPPPLLFSSSLLVPPADSRPRFANACAFVVCKGQVGSAWRTSCPLLRITNEEDPDFLCCSGVVWGCGYVCRWWVCGSLWCWRVGAVGFGWPDGPRRPSVGLQGLVLLTQVL